VLARNDDDDKNLIKPKKPSRWAFKKRSFVTLSGITVSVNNSSVQIIHKTKIESTTIIA